MSLELERNRLVGTENKLKKEKEGHDTISVTTSSDSIIVVQWADSNAVHVMSNFIDKEPTVIKTI